VPRNNHTLDITTLENWLWEAACAVRGPLDAAKYKDYILPLLFYKRLCDVFDDELEDLAQDLGRDLAHELAQSDRTLTRAFIPSEHCWREVRRSPEELGERLTTALKEIGRENPKLQGVIDRRDFNIADGGQRLLEDEVLAHLMEILNRHTLGLDEVEADILGRAYEYLLRKFAEGSGQRWPACWNPRRGTPSMTPPAARADCSSRRTCGCASGWPRSEGLTRASSSRATSAALCCSLARRSTPTPLPWPR
jgi:type I restriction enzyme M protein